MTSISKNLYINNLADIVNKCKYTYHSTIKMRPIDVKPSTNIDFNKEDNKENLKFEVGDHVRISKYKNPLATNYVRNWSEEIFLMKKVKNTVQWTCVISNLDGAEIVGTFYKKELQKEFRVKKVIKKKGDKLYVNYNNYL